MVEYVSIRVDLNKFGEELLAQPNVEPNGVYGEAIAKILKSQSVDMRDMIRVSREKYGFILYLEFKLSKLHCLRYSQLKPAKNLIFFFSPIFDQLSTKFSLFSSAKNYYSKVLQKFH